MRNVIVTMGLLLMTLNAEACFLAGERTTGMNKICYYNCVDGTRAITIRATQLCPLSLRDSQEINLGIAQGIEVRSEAATEIDYILSMQPEKLRARERRLDEAHYLRQIEMR